MKTGFVHRVGLAVASALLAVLALGVATADAARVANPGSVQFRFESGTLQIRDETFSTGSSSDPAIANGTIAANGNVTISSFQFPPIPPIAGPLGDVNISVNVLSSSGHVNPLTGAGSFTASLRIDADGGGVGGDCRISPINLNMTTAAAGGVPYNTSNGTLTVADHTFSVPGAQGCTTFPVNVNDEINNELGLPSPSGQNHAVLTARSIPILQKAIVPAFVANPSSGPAPLPVNFDASSTFHTRPISSYQWDFQNDGTFDATTSGPTTSFTYATPGTRTVRLRVTDADGDSQETTRQVVVNPAPDLTLTKSHTGDFVSGETETYSIEVANTGSAAATGTVTVTDTLPADMTFAGSASAGWNCSDSGQTVTCTSDDDIGVGGSAPPLAIDVVPGNGSVGFVTNTATVDVDGDVNASNDTAEDVTRVLQAGIDLAVSKTVEEADGLLRGRRATYVIGVTNVGTATAVDRIRVVDELPAGLTYVSAAGGLDWTCSFTAPTLRCFSDEDLPAGDSLDDIRVRVEVDTDAPSAILNTASVSVNGDTGSANNATTHAGPVNGYATDYALGKSHTGEFVAGEPGFYRLTVVNVGTKAGGNDITVLDVLPAGLSYHSAAGDGWSCSAVDQDVTCEHAGGVEAGDSLPTLTIRVDVDGSAAPSVTNSAAVFSDDDFNVENDVASDPTQVRSPAADLKITKTHEGNFTSNSQGTYTIAVENTTQEPAPGPTTVTDTLPAGLAYVSASGTDWACAAAGQEVTCSYAGTIAGGASAPPITLVVTTAPSAAGTTVVNVADVANAFDGNAANNSASDPTVIEERQQPTELVAEPWLLSLHVGSSGQSLLGGPKAHLRSDGEPVAGKTLRFWAPPSLFSPSGLICEAVTDASGTARCPFLQSFLLLGISQYTVTFAGDDDYKPATARGPVVRFLGFVL